MACISCELSGNGRPFMLRVMHELRRSSMLISSAGSRAVLREIAKQPEQRQSEFDEACRKVTIGACEVVAGIAHRRILNVRPDMRIGRRNEVATRSHQKAVRIAWQRADLRNSPKPLRFSCAHASLDVAMPSTISNACAPVKIRRRLELKVTSASFASPRRPQHLRSLVAKRFPREFLELFREPCDLSQSMRRLPESQSSTSALLLSPLMYRVSAPG